MSEPSVTTNITSITPTSFVANGEITVSGGSDSTSIGFVYIMDSTSIPTIDFYDDIYFEDGIFGAEIFNHEFTGLEIGTNYRIRSYAINLDGIGYGDTIDVLTSNVDAPELITYDSTSITDCSFVADGEILNTGGELIINPNPPNITGLNLSNATKIGEYNLNLILIPEISAGKYPESLLRYSDSVTIAWNTTDATYVTLDENNVQLSNKLIKYKTEILPPSGSIVKTPEGKAIYTLTAYNKLNTAIANVQISSVINKYEDTILVTKLEPTDGWFGIIPPLFSTLPEYIFVFQLPISLTITHEAGSNVELYYTINNGTPTSDSELYISSLSITNEYFDSTSIPPQCVIKAIAYNPINYDYSSESTSQINLIEGGSILIGGEIFAGDLISSPGIEPVSGLFYKTIIVFPVDIIDTDSTANETIQITGIEPVSGLFYETIIVFPVDIIDTDSTANETIQITGIEPVSGVWWQSVIEG